MYIKKEADVA
jgi:hypothetical protein